MPLNSVCQKHSDYYCQTARISSSKITLVLDIRPQIQSSNATKFTEAARSMINVRACFTQLNFRISHHSPELRRPSSDQRVALAMTDIPATATTVACEKNAFEGRLFGVSGIWQIPGRWSRKGRCRCGTVDDGFW